MRPTTAVVVPLLVAIAATATGVALAVRSGGYAPARTATGTVTIAAGAGTPGTFPARYCGSYGNVATQRGYAYVVDLPGATLTLADSVHRTPGAQDPANVTLTLTRRDGVYAWGPDRGGTVTLGAELLTADVDVHLVSARGDTVPLRAHFACRPRVAPRRPA